SKALLASGELLHHIAHADKMGVTVGEGKPDWPAIQKRKDRVLKNLRGGIQGLFKARKVALFRGVGRLDGPGKVTVTDSDGKTETIGAAKVILAAGSVPARIPGWPSDPSLVCTSDEALHWDTLPESLLIVGGGVIGCEFACMLQAMGVKVTVVEMMPRLLPEMDAELGPALQKIFRQRKITCHVDARVEELTTVDGGIRAKLAGGEEVSADRVLLAIGRRPATDDLGLETVGVERTQRGFVKVDSHMQTSADGVYCIGDANGGCLLAHAASAHGITAVRHAMGEDATFDSPVPWAVYTFPEIAGVGMTEAAATEKGLPISVGRFPIGHLGKAMAVNDTDGFVKVIRHRETDELLGVHLMGHNVTEIVAAAGTMLHTHADTHELAETVFAHPTISEAVKEAAEDALGAALHLPPRKIVRVEGDY
ncbi:MAG: dihydrolipoyl dehydrogenase, partial [Phycisphaerae bacterium]